MSLNLNYNPEQKKKASTFLSIAKGEFESAEVLIEKELYRESIVHMYFCCFYIAKAFLVHKIRSNAGHKSVDINLHKFYSKNKKIPNFYIKLHSFLHELRTKHNYREFHSPPPSVLEKKLNRLRNYVSFAFKNIPKTTVLDIMREIYEANKDFVRNFSYDVYCPKTYSHHTRITFWQPPFYLGIFPPEKICEKVKKMLFSLKVKQSSNYVLGLNSRLDQYSDIHLIMLDIDTLDAGVEESLHAIGGVVLKSGRGLHFISRELIHGKNNWEKKMREILRNSTLKEYIDTTHITMSIKRGYSTLRITKNHIKPSVPIFYKEL